MDAQTKELTQSTRKTVAAAHDASSPERAKHAPFLVLGILTTLLAMGFNYFVYDNRISTRAAGNRVLRTELSDGGAFGGAPSGGDAPASTALGVITNAINIADDIVLDGMSAVRGKSGRPSTADRVAVIAIDETSLVRHSSWPWPRTDIAALLKKAEGAEVIGLDILFPEQDKTSLTRYLPRVNHLFGASLDANSVDAETLDNDLLLARQIARTPTVIGNVLFGGAPSGRRLLRIRNTAPVGVVLPDGGTIGQDGILLEDAKYAITSIGRMRGRTASPVGEGFLNLFPTFSGMVRSIPLLARVYPDAFDGGEAGADVIVPSLVLEVMRAHLGGDAYRVNLRGDTVRLPVAGGGRRARHAVSGVSILGGGRELMTLPLSEFADMEVMFRNHEGDYTVYPAWEVLAGMHDGAFRDKIVLVGSTVASVGYVVSAGLREPEVFAVAAHASMIAAMLKGDFLNSSYRHDYFWRQVCVFAAGLAVTLAVALGGMGAGAVAAALCALGVVVANYLFFFTRGLDVGVTIPVLSTLSVFAVLVASNYLSVGRERRFIRRAFALNVSPSILSYLESHPDQLTSLQGEHRHMTVLFTDIRNFTSMSERMAAPDLARFLNEYFTPMSDIVMQNTGTVDKFIGDGMMAFWNAPTDNPNHARDAARAALDMVAKLNDLQPDWTARGLPRIAIGCGINTGMMFAGNMGSEHRKNYTVMGDNVNIASRLENLNKVYSSSILVTESTREKLGRDFVCRVVDKVRVSGKEEPVVIYELLGEGALGEEKVEELAAFARVFELYQQKEFATADTLLKELVFIRPAPLYKLYLDRLAIYKALPPPADWDGTFAKMTK